MGSPGNADKSQIVKDFEYHEDFILSKEVENTAVMSKSRMSNMIEFWFLKNHSDRSWKVVGREE